jgi:hypothetical protein
MMPGSDVAVMTSKLMASRYNAAPTMVQYTAPGRAGQTRTQKATERLVVNAPAKMLTP